jgi:hypothetical protein
MGYDEVLAELQGLLGSRVAVLVGPSIRADGEIPFVARLRGDLGWASEEADQHAEEMMVFWVGPADQAVGDSYFTIRRRLFENADWEMQDGYRQLVVMQTGVWLAIAPVDESGGPA